MSKQQKGSKLDKEFKVVRSMNKSLRMRIHLLDLKTTILGGFYIIFQALMYGQAANPVSAPAPPSRAQTIILWWFPACLSAFVSLAFWPAFIDTVNDCLRSRWQQESTFIEQERISRNISTVRDGGAAAQRSLEKVFASVRRKRRAYVGVLYSALLLFTLGVPTVFISVPANHYSSFDLYTTTTSSNRYLF